MRKKRKFRFDGERGLMDYEKLYHEVMQTFQEIIDDFYHDLENIEQDMKDGEKGIGIQLKQREVGTKIKILREAICYMESAEETAKDIAEYAKGVSDEG